MILIPLFIAGFVFWFVINVVKTTAVNALTVASIVFLLYVAYGITPTQIWDFVINLPQYILDFVAGDAEVTTR